MPGRHGGAVLPEIERIDLRADRPERQRFLSPTLRRAVAGTVAAGEQAMLFLNRPGYSPLALCDHCGFRLECPHCTPRLTEHHLAAGLHCHTYGRADESRVGTAGVRVSRARRAPEIRNKTQK